MGDRVFTIYRQGDVGLENPVTMGIDEFVNMDSRKWYELFGLDEYVKIYEVMDGKEHSFFAEPRYFIRDYDLTHAGEQ